MSTAPTIETLQTRTTTELWDIANTALHHGDWADAHAALDALVDCGDSDPVVDYLPELDFCRAPPSSRRTSGCCSPIGSAQSTMARIGTWTFT